VVPPPEDLSQWKVPTLVQAAAPVRKRPALPEAKPTAAEKVHDYVPGATYTIPVALGAPLDIVLERGEKVRNVVDGDREPHGQGEGQGQGAQAPRRWELKEGAEGRGDTERHHLFLTVTEAKLKNGITITTDRRTYYLTCESVPSSPIRVVRWRYAAEPGEERSTPEETPGILPAPRVPAQYHVGYEVQSRRQAPEWMPRHVVDDGQKVYILYPESLLAGHTPLVRGIGPNGPQLINARQYLNVVIVDEMAARLELRVGVGDTAEVVTITRGRLRTIQCPEDSACPQWPEAASLLARRRS
jgi:type IV secretion system protein VirB9